MGKPKTDLDTGLAATELTLLQETTQIEVNW